MATTQIVLHNYATSPFSEKVRLILGIKNLEWASVEIPNMMPKPDLMPLTGGYRKTPVLQIGADIYCDTQLIIRELDRRFPGTPVRAEGLALMIGMWADKPFFQATVPIIFGALGPMLPEAFKKDREALFPGRPFSVDGMKAITPMMMDAWRAHAGWIEAALADGRPCLMGDVPEAADAHAFMNVWFLASFTPPLGQQLMAGLPRTRDWAARVRAIGHGRKTEMDSKTALAIAKESTSEAVAHADSHDSNGRKPGDRVRIAADDYGRDPVEGELVFATAQEIAVRRSDPQTGEVVVHFPRAGFWVTPA